MKVHIDFSIFASPTEAYGNVTGFLELPEAPALGDTISFLFPQREMPPPAFPFEGMLKVEGRRFDLGEATVCSISLSDLYVDGQEEACALMTYFENGFGLKGYPYA